MKRTLQDQYLLIKEGKGHKDVFMKEAKNQFPGLIRNAATFNEVATVLKDKNIIKENVVGTPAINQLPGTKKESFEVAFEKFLHEAKDTYFEDEKAEVKDTSKQVKDTLSHNFDRADQSNPDNLIFDQIMKGYYTEMKDPKNADKTMEQLKAIVFKNLEKNPIYYTEKGQFGVKDLGYTTEAPGLGTPKEPKGPHKSSGYGNLNEGKINEDHQKGDKVVYKGTEYEVVDETDTIITLKDKNGNIVKKNYAQFKKGEYKESLEEQKIRKVIRESIEKELAEINKMAETEVLESKLQKINDAIMAREDRMSRINEDEDMKDLTDKKKIKQLEKDIKILKKAHSKIEKQLEKANKKNKGAKVEKKEVIDEEDLPNEKEVKDTTKAVEELGDAAKKTGEELEKAGITESDPPTNLLDEATGMFNEYLAEGCSCEKAATKTAIEFHPHSTEVYDYLMEYAKGKPLDY